jgi:large subunit ribosomal protein L9
MRVILMQDILHTGKRGEVLDVRPGYARNFLLPQGLALEATPGNMEVFEQQRRKIELKHEQNRDEALEVASRLQGLTVEVAKRASEGETLYGSVTAAEIGEALVRKGISIDNRRIDLEGGIKTLGEHPVRIGLHSDVIAEITVNVVAEEE